MRKTYEIGWTNEKNKVVWLVVDGKIDEVSDDPNFYCREIEIPSLTGKAAGDIGIDLVIE